MRRRRSSNELRDILASHAVLAAWLHDNLPRALAALDSPDGLRSPALQPGRGTGTVDPTGNTAERAVHTGEAGRDIGPDTPGWLIRDHVIRVLVLTAGGLPELVRCALLASPGLKPPTLERCTTCGVAIIGRPRDGRCQPCAETHARRQRRNRT